MKRLIHTKALSLVEILVAAAIAAFMVGIILSFYYSSNKTYAMGISRQQLQDGANVILAKIIEGKSEGVNVFRLSEATSYNIASISELRFVGTDAIERRVRLNDSSTSVLYRHPTASGTTDEVLYSAPAGTTITLRFSTPSGAQYTGVVVGIDVAITKNVSGRTISGSASAYVNIRNHAV